MNTAGTTCSATSPSATTSLYSYDGEGHRTSSSNNGVTNAFIWDTGASQLLADSTHDYVYLQGSVTPDLQINLTTGTVDLLIQDQNANTRGVVQVVGTNSTFDGTIVNYTDFDVYGNAITQSGGSVNPGGMSNGGVSTDISTSFAFGAGYWDSSNLTYLVHRYLDNETGQFISVDPLVDQTREAYVYAGDGPVMQRDPRGLALMAIDDNVGRKDNRGHHFYILSVAWKRLQSKNLANPDMLEIVPSINARIQVVQTAISILFPFIFAMAVAENIRSMHLAWSEVLSQASNRANTNSMYNQFACHWYFVRYDIKLGSQIFKRPFHLNLNLPDRGLIGFTRKRCN